MGKRFDRKLKGENSINMRAGHRNLGSASACKIANAYAWIVKSGSGQGREGQTCGSGQMAVCSFPLYSCNCLCEY